MRKPLRSGRPLSIETVAGDPVTANGVTVTPVTRVLAVRTPFGGLVWNRPVEVRIEGGGRVERMRIVDVNRAVQVGLLLCSIAVVVAAAALSRRKE